MINKIVEGVHILSTLNPDLRIFDVIMETKYGTTYNSYLVQGKQKNVLIDTAHRNFESEFFSEIEKIIPIEKIDYLIVNHCEPDHSGSIKDLILKNKNIEIFCTPVSANFLKNITNISDLKIHVVKDGETLDLGNKKIKFVVAPFLHWPDSMFSYLEEDKIVFTCDFFGAHFCEKEGFDSKIKNLKIYESEFKNYYDAIFGPFSTFVRSGLNKLSSLDYKTIAPSHGPILTQNGQLDSCFKKYHEWSKEKPSLDYIPIFYCSAYGNTEKIADALASGFNCKYKLFNVIEHKMCDLHKIINEATCFGIGSPTLNKNALPPIINLIAGIDCINVKNKNALVFGSFGWSGESNGIVKKLLESMGIKCFENDLKICFVPDESDLTKAREVGKVFSLNFGK